MSLVKRLIEIWLLGRAAATGNAFLGNLLARMTTIIIVAISASIISLLLCACLLALIYISLADQGFTPASIIMMIGGGLLVLLLVILYFLRQRFSDVKKTSHRFMRQKNPLTDGLATTFDAFVTGLCGRRIK